jgi:hypothetical protein
MGSIPSPLPQAVGERESRVIHTVMTCAPSNVSVVGLRGRLCFLFGLCHSHFLYFYLSIKSLSCGDLYHLRNEFNSESIPDLNTVLLLINHFEFIKETMLTVVKS